MADKEHRSIVQKITGGVSALEWEKGAALVSGSFKHLANSISIDLNGKISISGGFLALTFDYVQAAVKGVIKQKFISDITGLVELGKIPDDFLNDDLNRRTYLEIAEIIDKENPEVDKVEAMKALLITVVDKSEKARYEVSTYLNTLRQLDSVELNIVMSSYKLRKEGRSDQKQPRTKDNWRRYILEQTGWDEIMVYEIEKREEHLVDLRLIDSHPGVDSNNLPLTNNCRLTGLAIKIGDILTKKVV